MARGFVPGKIHRGPLALFIFCEVAVTDDVIDSDEREKAYFFSSSVFLPPNYEGEVTQTHNYELRVNNRMIAVVVLLQLVLLVWRLSSG